MSSMTQAKLLRVLQERELRRLGGTRLIKANVRVIALTTHDLRLAVSEGSFRQDLFYRLR
jgi:transcriptional regulator with GAF, ATPase, and Fis domain